MTYQETAYQKTNIVDSNGNVINSFGGSGGGGDASATNQSAQIALETAIRDRLPNALLGGRLPVDGSGATQPISALNLPLPIGAATDVTLQQVRDAIKAQLDIASTIWTDNSGVFYVRRDVVNEGTGTITVAFTDPSGSTATPSAGLRPLATTDKDTITDFYDVLTSGTGYSVGDLLGRVAILDANSGSPSATFIWLNLTTGTILSSAPTGTNIERANENVGARQIGAWNVVAALDTTNSGYLSNLNAAIGTAITGATMPSGGAGWFGWLSAIWNLINVRVPILSLIGSALKVDGSGVTQPVSLSSIPLASNAATDTTLQQVRDAIKATIDIASTIWTDNSGAFYVRRDLINEGTGAITVAFTDPSGSATTPGAGLRPLATTDKDTITDFYDVLTSSTGYSVGDLLSRVAILDANSGSPSASFIWLNLTVGTILSSAPTAANIERANENVGARQVGTWTVAISNLNADPATATLQGVANTKLTSIDNKTSPLGANTTANSQPFTIATDDAIAIAIRDRIGGTAITGTTMPSGGVGLFGWLSAIWQMISDRIPTLALIGSALSVTIRANSTGVGGQTPYKLISTATTNAASVKIGAGNLYSIVAIGLTSTVRYLKFYNKASAPTVGTDTPSMTIPIPANTQGAGIAIQFTSGVNFNTGIAIAITAGITDSDTTAIAANDVVVNLTYS
ncbi:MAG: hypothetical protein V7L31_20985 [Nostoc sp.]|uniref:hypothetical protein n=1 Tax=Nostoc sp. TaxID=1180 RepID=UPI002FF375A5